MFGFFKEAVMRGMFAGVVPHAFRGVEFRPVWRQLEHLTDDAKYRPQLLRLLRSLWRVPIDDELERLMAELEKAVDTPDASNPI
jgi:hypothetical protein